MLSVAAVVVMFTRTERNSGVRFPSMLHSRREAQASCGGAPGRTHRELGHLAHIRGGVRCRVDRGTRTFPQRAWFDLLLIVLTPPFGVPDTLHSIRSLRVLRLFRLLRALGSRSTDSPLAARHLSRAASPPVGARIGVLGHDVSDERRWSWRYHCPLVRSSSSRHHAVSHLESCARSPPSVRPTR
jgi:hypothetical protein